MDSMSRVQKTALRKEMKSRLASLTPKQVSKLSYKVMLNAETGLRDLFRTHLGVLYIPMTSEVNPMELVTLFKEVAFVRIESSQPPELSLRQCDPFVKEQIEAHEGAKFSVQQPAAQCPIVQPKEKNTVILVPGLAFTAAGQRLGRGGGFYDSLLANYPEAFRVGVGFHQQLVSELPIEMHDLDLDAIVTDKDWILTRARK
jgi:5-formyltetrahydrofolate cyclo-ligase